MIKKILFFCVALSFAPCVMAQEVFWGYDEENRELIVPPECDSVQESDELYEVGMRLFNETGYARQGASYCLLAAAMDNHPKAQYQVAHMYHKGQLLPKSDLAAYKWATLAALNGSEEADRLGANIEQFLSIQDIEASTRSLEALLPVITQSTQKQLADEKNKQEMIKQSIKAVDAEIRDLKKYGYIRKKTLDDNKKAAADLKVALQKASKSAEEATAAVVEEEMQKTTARPGVYRERPSTKERARENEAIFSENELDEVPMPFAI